MSLYKTILGILKIALHLRGGHIFVTITGYFERFHLRTFTKIENEVIPYQTASSKANLKTNRMESTKWTYHKERSFATNYFIFLII